MRAPLVRTARLLLRPCVPEDREAFVRTYERSWATHLAPWFPRTDTPADFSAMFTRQLERSRDELGNGSACRLFAFDSQGGLAGAFNLNNIVRGNFQCANAGWWVSADHVRQGLATEGVRAILRLAFLPQPKNGVPDGATSGLGLHRVQCAIIPRNQASLGVAAKAGFRREGLAQRYLEIAGAWEDHVILARTAEEGVTE